MADLRAEAGVLWSKAVFQTGETLSAKIHTHDGAGTPATRIIWTLLRNGFQVYNGEGAAFSYLAPQTGLYRLTGTAYFQNSSLTFDSAVSVPGSVNVRHTLPVPEAAGTMVYLGAVFTQTIAAASGEASALPHKLASATEEIFLLPGTTHWTFDLDPAGTTVDDEVVVRTQKGNWCLNGLAGGLSGQEVGYDYGYMPTFIPAPIDHRIQLTAEMLKIVGTVYNGFNTRVRIKCYRNLPGGIYAYSPCASSNHPGGLGRRLRRWAALFTDIDLQVDVFNTLGRDRATVAYTTTNTTSVPLVTLSTSGTPHPVPGYSGLFYTDSNLCAFYEADGYANIQAHAIASIESVRPCCISLLNFANSKPIISNRIKRLYGKLAVYVTDGVVLAGSTVSVKIYKSDGLAYTTYTLPVSTTVYANESDTIGKVGELDISLADYQFDETGLVIDFTVTEPLISDPLPSPMPTPVVGASQVYSPVYAHSVAFDGACYTSPTFVPVFDDDAAVVTLIGGCQDPVCGPNGLYCYSALDAPAESVELLQPLGRPSPYVAFGTNPARCFYNPIPVAAVSGTQVSTMEFTGSMAVDLWTYSGTSLCGAAYAYNDCQSVYAPCLAYDCSIVVVYPVVSSPHTVIQYGGRCYSYVSATTDYGTRRVVSVVDVNPVLDCHDPDCAQFNASGSVIVYNDTQTGLEVPVRFDHLDRGVPYFAVSVETSNDGLAGLVSGTKTVIFDNTAEVLLFTAGGTGALQLQFGYGNLKKQILIYRGQTIVYNATFTNSRHRITVQSGDKVWVRVADSYGRLPLQYRSLRLPVSWHALPVLPRLYDTAVAAYAGTSAIRALGFCAYTDAGVYSFYGSLPFSGSMTGPVNPDSWVTVTGQDGQEYSLLSMRAVGDAEVYPVNAPWYSGQNLVGPFTFKFYAARQPSGAHGEMDVWFSADGTLPGYLRAGPYSALELNGTYTYRKDSTILDTQRNAYTSVTDSQAAEAVWPNAYVGSTDGEVISSVASSTGITRQAKSYQKLAVDSGLSKVVLSSSDIEILWAHISDYGFDYPSRTDISAMIHGWNPDFIVTAGDNWQSGGTNTLADLDIKTGAYYQDFIFPYIGTYGAGASEQRFLVAPGNHDYTPAGVGPVFPPTYRLPMFMQYFNLAAVNYDVLKWPVHFFLLDNTDYMTGSETLTGPTALWLQAKLAASTAPWKVVIEHYPPWCSSIAHPNYVTRRWPFKSWGADIVFSGHDHVYERFAFADGFVAIVCGTCNPAYWTELNPAAIWQGSAVADSVFGYGVAPQLKASCRMRATSARLLVEYVTSTGVLVDSVTLTK